MTLSRPRPVLTSAGITGAIQAVATIVGFLGYSNTETSINGATQTLVAVVLGVLTLGGNLLHGLHAQAQVTPISSPLVPAGAVLAPLPVPGVLKTAAELVAEAQAAIPPAV